MRLSFPASRWCVIVTLTMLAWVSDNARAQQTRSEGPRFWVASADRRSPAETVPGQIPFLGSRINLAVNDVPLTQVLSTIARQTGVMFVYGPDAVQASRRISIRANNLTLAAVLTEILFGADVDVLISGRQQITLVPAMGVKGEGGRIVGRVTDSATGRTVAAADVYLEGTRWRTATDSNGKYALIGVDPNVYVLIVRRLGYEKQSRRITILEGRTDTVDLALSPIAARLNELVTTATGRRRRVELANDVTTLNADSLMRTQPVSSVTDLLEARVPGLSMQRTSGAPGDPSRLRLRGVGSLLRNNDPIVIVDGIRLYAEQSAGRSGNLAERANDTTKATRFTAPSPLDYIDPNSIATIEVFKGPSASTLYGQDAANGVIVITTKKGQAGPSRWSMMAEHGQTRIAGSYPELFIRWGHRLTDSDRVLCPANGQSRNLLGVGGSVNATLPCQGDSLVTFQLLNDTALTVLDKGYRSMLTLGVSGGSAALTYSATGTYEDEVGLIKLPSYEIDRYQARVHQTPPHWMQRPQRFKRWGVTSHLQALLGTKAEVSLATSLMRSEQQRSSLEQQLGKLMGTYLDRTSGTYYQTNVSHQLANAVDGANVLNGSYTRATDAATNLIGGATLSWRPHTWLSLRTNAGLNLQQRADQVFLPRGAAISGGVDTTGRVSYGHGQVVTSTVDAQVEAVAPLRSGFRFRFITGVNYAGRSVRDLSIQTWELPLGTSLVGDSIWDVQPREEDVATFGWFVAPALDNNRFFLDLGLRIDGGSANGNGVTLPKFPKLGFSYVISDEPFYPLKNLIPSLRLRMAYGRASRQPGEADWLRLYAEPRSIWGDGAVVPGVVLQKLGNTKLRPEVSAEFEGGFEADLLDSRLRLEFTGYRKTTEDALLSVPLPPSVYGHSVTTLQNIGVVQNSGLNAIIETQWVRNDLLTFGTRLLVSQNRNVVVKLGPGVEPFYTSVTFGDPTTIGSGLRVATGYPVNGRWAKPVLGYADMNGNNRIDRNEILVGDTAVYVGSTLPNYQATLETNAMMWRGAVRVSVGLTYEDGLSQRNEVAWTLAGLSRGFNDPAASFAEQVGVSNVTDYNWIQTVNTVRLNTLAVSYTVPTAIARRVGARSLSVAVQGRNLGLWTNYSGLDPNVNAFGTGNNVTDTGILPEPRTWQVRLNATY